MKITDKTPFVDAKGNLGFMERIQAMLEYGFNWPRELEAQTTIIKYFDRELGKGYNLIRNLSLGQSGIMIPMILLGPTGIYVIEVTHLKGRYEAKGETWNMEAGESYKPAPVNLIQRTMRMARALAQFIERQGARLPADVEPVLIAGDPGLHIESNRPAIKVMMIDGIKAFVAGVVGGRPVMSAEMVHDFTDRILNPRPKQEMSAPEPELESEQKPAWEENVYSWDEQPATDDPEPSRARAIFDASKDVQPYNPNDFSFAMGGETDDLSDIPPVPREVEPIKPMRPVRKNNEPKQQRLLGMAPWQAAVVGGLGLTVLCLAGVLIYLFAF